MKLIITKLKFKNFMAYYGELEFEFPIKDGKNVSIIYAPNDVGKSCFFKAINFALFGKKRGQNLKDLININALTEKDFGAHVSIFGEHNNKKLQITRSILAKYEQIENPDNSDFQSSLEIFENGDPVVEDDYKAKYDYINAIVHEDAAKYFFFDGEKIEAYNIASKTEYKEPITRILGIKEIENAKGDFEKLESEYEDERDDLLKKRKEAREIVNEKKKIEKKIEDLKKDMQDHDAELKSIKQRIVSLEDELKNHEEVQEKIERKQFLRKRKKELKEEIDQIEKRKTEIFKDNGTIILGCDMAENIRIENNIDYDSKNDTYEVSENLKSFLEYIKEEDKCICGNDIDQTERKNIQNYIEDNIQNDNKYKKEREKRVAFYNINQYVQHAATAKKEYIDKCKEKVESQKELNNVEEEFYDLQSDIGSYDEDAASRISEEITRLETKQDDIKDKKKGIEIKLDNKYEELDKINNELRKFSSANEEFKLADQKLSIAKRIKNVFSGYLETLTKTKKKEVEEKSTNVFLQLTNKKRKYKGLVLTDDYELKIKLNDGTTYVIEPGKPHNPSTGQSKIISLSYIAGINQSSNSQAPIVIDNPLGLFSKEHRKRVTQYIPNFGKQVIFMVTTADLSEKYKKIIEPNVNVEYYLEDKSSSTWNKTRIAEKVIK
ncbi:MAG: AAA family ATPase [Candidatus Woesearchaeota archaeon]